jgi:hypothetical protein
MCDTVIFLITSFGLILFVGKSDFWQLLRSLIVLQSTPIFLATVIQNLQSYQLATAAIGV